MIAPLKPYQISIIFNIVIFFFNIVIFFIDNVKILFYIHYINKDKQVKHDQSDQKAKCKMQSLNLSPVDQILNSTSSKFDAEFSQGDALVIPTNGFSSYGRPLFRVTECEIFMLREDGSVWDEYDMPEDGDVVSEIVKIMSSIGL